MFSAARSSSSPPSPDSSGHSHIVREWVSGGLTQEDHAAVISAEEELAEAWAVVLVNTREED